MNIKNENIIGNLKKIKIYYNNKELQIREYEKVNCELLLKDDDMNKTSKVLIHPGGDTIGVVSILITVIYDYLRNMLDSSNSILENINYGDIIEIGGARTKFKEVVDNSICLEYADGAIYLPLDQSYKMTRYNGPANTLSKMPTKRSTKASKTKGIISEIFDINAKELSNMIKYSTIILISKEKVYEIIRNMKIGFYEEKYEITSLFPFAYYSSLERHNDFAGNATKVEPIIKFVSKISTARDLIQNNRDIKSVVIIGEELYKNNPMDLEWIMKRKSIECTTLILEWSKISTLENIFTYKENLSLYAWSKNAIFKNVNILKDKSCTNKISPLNLEQQRLIVNFTNRKVEVIETQLEIEFSGKLIETRKLIMEIAKSNVTDEFKDQFLKISYSLLTLYEKSCFPLKFLEQMIESQEIIGVHPKNSINRLQEISVYLDSDVFDRVNCNKAKVIIFNLKLIREEMLNKNYKWNQIIKLIRQVQSRKSALVLFKSYYIDVLNRSFEENNIVSNIKMYPFSSFNPSKLYDEILITGVYLGKKFDIFNNCYSKNMRVMLYESELKYYKCMNNKNNYNLNIVDRLNLLVDYIDEGISIDKNIVNNAEYEVKELLEIEYIISELTKKQILAGDNFFNYTSKCECIKVAIFENGEKAYFTKYFLPSLLDRAKEDVKDVKIEDLVSGDELIFKKDERDLNRDIIQDITEKLMESEEFNKEFKESLVLCNYWKNILKKHMKITGRNENIISNELKKLKVSRGAMAISTWIKDGKSTAPIEEGVYKALAYITGDIFFVEHWCEICEACSKVRKLHIKLKKYLGKSIVNSVINERKTDFDKIVEQCIGDISKLAQIVQIEQIYDIKVEVPIYMANKLIET